MRSIVAACFLLGVGSFAPGCAHSASPDAEVPDPEAEEARMARLGHENAGLRKDIRNLEERLRFFEGSEDAGASVRPDRHLPVVNLEPEGGYRAEPKHMREAVTLSPLPSTNLYESALEPQFESEPEPEPRRVEWTPPSAPESVQSSPDDVRSYKLVGDRLVNLTKRGRPPAPPTREKSLPRRAEKKKQSGIVSQYDAAMAVYRDGVFADAEHAFDSFVRSYPNHDYADNALYWKGEAAYDQAHYADALAAFTEVVERYGGGNKAPDALLKIGLCYGKLGDAANAKDVLTQLIAAYPEAGATQIAHRKLDEF